MKEVGTAAMGDCCGRGIEKIMITQKKKLHVAVAGATGAVGRKMLEILWERNFPVGQLTLLASANSKGTRLTLWE